MPVSDFVVDTNVLVHASNVGYCKQNHCIDIINRLMQSSEMICLDENGFIKSEYQRHLKPGMLGYTLLLALANPNKCRLRIIDRSIPAHINNKINKTGIKKQDRIFVRIAFKSTDKILVTQEYEDFVDKIRHLIKSEIEVSVIEAGEFIRDY